MNLPQGFRYTATYAGIRKVAKNDVALIVSDKPASSAAVFTQNNVVAAPVVHVDDPALRAELASATFADVADLASGVRGREAVLAQGDMEGGMWWASQAQGLIDEVLTCAEIVNRTVADAERIIGTELPSLVVR